MVTFAVPIVVLPTGVPVAVIVTVLLGALATAVLTALRSVNEVLLNEVLPNVSVAVSPDALVIVIVTLTAALEWFTTFILPDASFHTGSVIVW